jgi:hypothetical protein
VEGWFKTVITNFVIVAMGGSEQIVRVSRSSNQYINRGTKVLQRVTMEVMVDEYEAGFCGATAVPVVKLRKLTP